jgi:hypothetical protein
MSFANGFGGLLAWMSVLAACSGSGEDPGATPEGGLGDTATELDAMLAGAHELGFSSAELEWKDGALLAQRDLILDPAILLELDRAATGDADLAGVGLSLEGYYIPALTPAPPPGQFSVKPPRANSIRLKFDAGVSDAWKKALRDAAVQWSANVCIEISESAGSDPLRISVDATLPATVTSVAYTPFKKNGVVLPGPKILVNPAFANPSALLYAALHDLGHILGYMHPASGTHIAGTKQDTLAGDHSSYSTVMSLAGPITGTLTGDDQKSRDLVFQRIPTQIVRNGQTVTVLQCPDGTQTSTF